MIFYLELYSKSYVTLKKFVKIFLKLIKKKVIKTFTIIKKKETKKSIFTILKSPHVNKIAQEQFEQKTYKRFITFTSDNVLKCMYVIKLIKKSLFSLINIKTKLSTSVFFKSLLLSKFNTDRFRLQIMKYGVNKKTKIYLNVLDAYGEIMFRQCKI